MAFDLRSRTGARSKPSYPNFVSEAALAHVVPTRLRQHTDAATSLSGAET